MLPFIRVLFLFIFIYGAQIQNVHAEDKQVKILIFGDSIVAGYGLPAEDAFPAQMEKLLLAEKHNVKIINAGISGDTTAGGKSRLAWTLEQNNPDIVILGLGGNDMLRGVDPSITKDNLDAMLAMLKEKKIKTVLTAVQAPLNFGLVFSKKFNAIYSDLADKYDVALYPFFLDGLYGDSKYMQADGIHPNSAGAAKIAKNLAEYLDDEIL